MKKTLLFFLLLFTSIFYAQVTSISICESQSFDLTSLKRDFIGNLNPAETSVTYFLSLNDAVNNTNVIANPTNYTGAIGQTKIYGRIDYNGTISTNYFNLTTFGSLKVTASHTPIICSEQTAALTINVSGGSGSYQYSLNGGPYTSNNYYKYLLAGTYHIEVKDAGQLCGASIDHIITSPQSLTVTAITVNQNTTITAAGGTAPYEYSLDGVNYQTSNVFSDLPAGTQYVGIKDSKGCSVYSPIVIGNTEFPLSSGGMTLKNVTCWGKAALRTFGYGGRPPYLYSIDGGITFQTSDTFDNLSAGTYPIAIKDSENTIINNLAIELSPYIPVTCTAVAINASSCLNDGGINIVANGGQIPHYYSIDGGKTYSPDNTFSDLPAGNYIVLVKDSNDCVSPAITTKIQQTPQLSATASHTELLCAKDKTVLTISAQGGEAPYQYSINNLIYKLSNTYTNLGPGTYQIKVKDAVGCITTIEHIITQPTPIYPDVVIEGHTVTLNGQAGTAPYQYSFDGAAFQTGNVFTNLSSGIHIIRIKDSKGCESDDFTVIIEDQKPLVSAITITKEMDCITNASIVISATGGRLPYLYSIDGGTNYFSSNIFLDLTANTYTIKVRDADNNTTTNSIVINPPIIPIITVTKTDISCNGSSNGSIKTTVITGSAPYLYSLNGNQFQSTDTFNNLSSGVYDVTVKDKNGCMAIASIAIAEPTLLNATVSTFEQTIVANVSGGNQPYSYSLEKEGIIVASPQTSNTFTNLQSGIFIVKIRDANGCTLSPQIYVAPLPTLSAIAVTDGINCFQPTGKITINVSGGLAPYLYSINNGTNYTASNVFNNLSSGTYAIRVKDAQGSTINITTTISPSLTANAVLIKGIDCVSNGSINVTAAGGSGNYQYSLNGGSFQTSNVFNNLTAGTYHFTIKDSNNCTVLTNDIILLQPVPLTATINYQPITDCSTNPITYIAVNGVGGKAPYQYSINNYDYQSSGVYGGAFPGTHIIKVKDANGCVYTTPLIIASPSSLAATATVNKATECGAKDSVTITATGGQGPYTYSFTGGVSFINSDTSSDLAVGNHTLFVKDSNGCQYTTYITVEKSLLSATTTTTDVYNKRITVNVTGGKAPYIYTLKDNSQTIISLQNENIFNNIAFGSYVVQVTDANGCSVSYNTELYSPLIISTIITNPVDGGSYGTITVNAAGGKAPYQYSINGNVFSSNNVFTNLVQGVYTINVRDSSNNISLSYIVIEPQNTLTATIAKTNVNCYGSNDGRILVNASGGVMPYTYSLYKNETLILLNSSANSFNNLAAGNYKVKVTDANGFYFLSSNISIQEPAILFATLVVDNQTITVYATGGNGLYDYSMDWTGYQTSNIFNNIPYGIHQVLVRDQGGCAVSIIVSIDPPAPLIEGKKVITVEFAPGQTLGDLIIEGQNIQWYSAPNSLTGKNNASEATLPLSTILVDGTTYYASQTINGIESTERLAVTAKVKGSLSTPDFVLPNFTYYPNPVQHTLNISNTSNIDEVEIFSVSGKSILSKKINNDHSEIDLSNVSSGFYFLKVKSEGKTKTIKIVKK